MIRVNKNKFSFVLASFCVMLVSCGMSSPRGVKSSFVGSWTSNCTIENGISETGISGFTERDLFFGNRNRNNYILNPKSRIYKSITDSTSLVSLYKDTLILFKGEECVAKASMRHAEANLWRLESQQVNRLWFDFEITPNSKSQFSENNKGILFIFPDRNTLPLEVILKPYNKNAPDSLSFIATDEEYWLPLPCEEVTGADVLIRPLGIDTHPTYTNRWIPIYSGVNSAMNLEGKELFSLNIYWEPMNREKVTDDLIYVKEDTIYWRNQYFIEQTAYERIKYYESPGGISVSVRNSQKSTEDLGSQVYIGRLGKVVVRDGEFEFRPNQDHASPLTVTYGRYNMIDSVSAVVSEMSDSVNAFFTNTTIIPRYDQSIASDSVKLIFTAPRAIAETIAPMATYRKSDSVFTIVGNYGSRTLTVPSTAYDVHIGIIYAAPPILRRDKLPYTRASIYLDKVLCPSTDFNTYDIVFPPYMNDSIFRELIFDGDIIYLKNGKIYWRDQVFLKAENTI